MHGEQIPRSRVLLAGVSALAGLLCWQVVSADRARAAGYLASCRSGGYAPQVCILVTTTVVSQLAGVGEYAIIQRVSPTVPAPDCAGTPGRVEQYHGKVRRGAVVGRVDVRLLACPEQPPYITATARYGAPSPHGYAQATANVRVVDGSPRFSFAYDESGFGVGGEVPNGYLSGYARGGSVFRRYSGVSASAAGRYNWCEYQSIAGYCDHGGQDDGAYSVRVDSSISAPWARLEITKTETPSDTRISPRTKRAAATSQPHDSGRAWKVTRTR